MTSPRKTPAGSTRTARTQRARRRPADTHSLASCERMLVEAAGITPQRVLIVTYDRSGALRMWCNGADPFEALAMVEYARSRLQLSAMRDEDPA